MKRLIVLTLGVSLYFLYWKFQLGQVRYFDLDEYAYLWWASHMHQGLVPYRDFFFYGTPGFLWFLTPFFSFFSGVTPFFAARVGMFCIFLFLLIASGLLFFEMRKTWIALVMPLLLLFLPLPSDKFIEIRPDTLGMMAFVFGLWLQIRGMNHEGKRPILFLGSGILYACSLLISQKMAILIMVATVGFIGWGWMRKKFRRIFLYYLLGAMGVGVIAFLWFFSLGNWPIIWYSLTKLPFEVSRLGSLFPIAPSFFFFPNDVVYGTPGYHIGYVLNLVVWTIGMCIGSIRLCSPIATNGKQGMWQELMVGTSFFLSAIFFMWFTPLKHQQYLIPLAVFVCFYVADGIDMMWKNMQKSSVSRAIFFVGSCAVFVCMVIGFMKVIQPKLWWRNDDSIQTAEKLFQTIPKTESILDLEGLTVYYPQVYYVSCLPIGQITPLASMKLPSLITRLQETDTKFIYQGTSRRLTTLSFEDQAYIAAHFIPIGDGTLLVRTDRAPSYVKILSK